MSSEGPQQHHASIGTIDLAGLMVAINERLLAAGIDRDRAIGHSHFLVSKDEVAPIDAIRSRLRFDVIPLIEEYCYADRGLMSQILGALVKADGQADDAVLGCDQSLQHALARLTAPLQATPPTMPLLSAEN
jgi:hypothetical protein